MRMILTLVLAIIAGTAFSQKTFTAITSPGDWNDPTTWGSNQIPGDNDIVIIPEHFIVNVKWDVYNKTTPKPNLSIRISGTLNFDASGVLDLGDKSIIQLYDKQAQITSTNGSASELIYIGGAAKYQANKTQTITGPAYADVNTPTVPSGFNVVILPVKLISFTAHKTGNSIRLNWTTAEEINSSHFVVERSTDARQWTTLKIVTAVGQASGYTATDFTPAAGNNFYRLKSVDKDGKSEYSPVLKVGGNKTSLTYVSPNPAKGQVTLTLSTATTSPSRLQLLSSNGQVVREANFPKGTSLVRLDLGGATPGAYILLLRSETTVIETSQLLIQ